MMSNNNFSANSRIDSIDVFRAVTMFFMIFVNDLWTLTNVPSWLRHVKMNVDGLGFADAIFPIFLFIVGLSIPLAINRSIENKSSTVNIIKNIGIRTIALVVMGLFMVNYKYLNIDLLAIDKHLWKIIMATGIFLVWMHYRSITGLSQKQVKLLQFTGIALLAALAISYQGGPTDNPHWMKIHWWGILGVIGWAYLVSALLYLVIGQRIALLVATVALLHFFNVQEFGAFIQGTPALGEGRPAIDLIVSASRYALVMSGVLATVIYLRLSKNGQEQWFLYILLALGAISLIYGFLLKPYWGGISKIRTTPSFTGICAGIGFIGLAVFYLVVDKFQCKKWADPIATAGTSTLTCYLLPYILYPVIALLALKLPEYLTTGYVGIVKSLLFAYLVIYLTGLLGKINIKLKV